MYLRAKDGTVIDTDDLYDYLGADYFDNEIDDYYEPLTIGRVKYDVSHILKVVDNVHYREIVEEIIDNIITNPEEYGFTVIE